MPQTSSIAHLARVTDRAPSPARLVRAAAAEQMRAVSKPLQQRQCGAISEMVQNAVWPSGGGTRRQRVGSGRPAAGGARLSRSCSSSALASSLETLDACWHIFWDAGS